MIVENNNKTVCQKKGKFVESYVLCLMGHLQANFHFFGQMFFSFLFSTFIHNAISIISSFFTERYADVVKKHYCSSKSNLKSNLDTCSTF